MQERAVALLEKWAVGVEPYWYPAGDDASRGCYGSGYLTWGVQSNWNYAGALATLSVQPSTREKTRWRDRALSAFRFALATHVTGGRPGPDGKCWGNSWISMLGIERAMHGLACVEPLLSDADRDALRRLLVSEADWLLLHAVRGRSSGVAAGLWNHDGCNNPESNVWSGCLLWRVAEAYPDESHADAWHERAHLYLMNGVSVEADAGDPRVVAGRPVSEWHVGANFFPHYALDHHGYLNVGYAVICMSNVAILHFDLKRAGLPPPESLYHHQDELWRVVRRMIFSDGRLARIGGDSRVRYAYCQEYLLPALLFAADHLRDPHALELAHSQLALIEHEARVSGDGSFYGRRLERLREGNPHYYTRLESDRACVLAMLLNYRPLVQAPDASRQSFEESVAGGWMESAHGAALVRSANRLCSFAWRAHGLTQGLCLPPGESSLAEWSLNLGPVVRFLGDDGTVPGKHRRLLANHVESFAGGFVTCGSVMEGVGVTIDEGATCTDQAVTHIAFAALPDNRTCLCLQYAVAADDRVGYRVELKDLNLVIPNDLFNGFRRTITTAGGQVVLTAPPEGDGVMAVEGRWLNVDGCLGIVALHGGDCLQIDRSTTRRAGRYRSLFTETVCLHACNRVVRCRPGEVLVDAGFALLSGATAEITARVRGGTLTFQAVQLRGIWIEGGDGRRHTLVANFGDAALMVDIFGMPVELAAGMAVLRQSPD